MALKFAKVSSVRNCAVEYTILHVYVNVFVFLFECGSVRKVVGYRERSREILVNKRYAWLSRGIERY